MAPAPAINLVQEPCRSKRGGVRSPVRVDATMSTDMSSVPSTAPTLSPIAYRWHGAEAAPIARSGAPLLARQRPAVSVMDHKASHWPCWGSYPDASVADPTPGGATAHGESEDHHSRGDDCDRDPEDGSTKNSLHDGRPLS
jgi:hypothetical protein